MNRKLTVLSLAAGIAMAISATSAFAAKYDAGASDTEVKVGNIVPYSGPASAYGNIGKAISAYFKGVNANGGINGRQINVISLDDGYSPPKTVEQARKLVEQERVLFLAATLGTPTNSAIHAYMNKKKVPHLFVNTGAHKWGDPTGNPWTMGLQPDYQVEGKIYAEHIMKNNPNAKIAILYQNDDYGKDYVKGMEDGLGDKIGMIVAKASYETTDPTVSNQMATLKGSGADTFFNVTTPKWAAQAIKGAAELGWKPTHYLNSVSSSVGSVMVPAGAENGIGIISSNYFKDPADPAWANDAGFVAYKAWMEKNMPGENIAEGFFTSGYIHAAAIEKTIEQAGDNLTRANIMKQAASLDFANGMLLPGVRFKTTATDFFPIENKQLMRWDGKSWALFGDVLGPK